MSVFRNFQPRSAFVRPCTILVDSIVQTPQSDGSVSVSVVRVDPSSVQLPKPSQYQFKDIVSAGLPLQVVSSGIVDAVPTSSDLVSVVNKIVTSDNKD